MGSLHDEARRAGGGQASDNDYAGQQDHCRNSAELRQLQAFRHAADAVQRSTRWLIVGMLLAEEAEVGIEANDLLGELDRLRDDLVALAVNEGQPAPETGEPEPSDRRAA